MLTLQSQFSFNPFINLYIDGKEESQLDATVTVYW